MYCIKLQIKINIRKINLYILISAPLLNHINKYIEWNTFRCLNIKTSYIWGTLIICPAELALSSCTQ